MEGQTRRERESKGMLTYPSDSLPPIVCPMDEHAITPNSFCSAPPHSEPPTPLLPLSSVTPSCAKNGVFGCRRSGRIQEIRGQTRSRQNPAPTKRQTESAIMVSQSKQPRVEDAHVREEQSQDGFDITFAADHQNEQKNQKTPNVSSADNVVEQFAVDATQNLDAAKADMDACGGLAVGRSFESASAPKRWVIGPLYQSFKLKMASFTEIVMSPVKLFRGNSPPPCTDQTDRVDESELQVDGASDVEHSEPSDALHPEAQSENGNQQRLRKEEGARNAITVPLKYSKKLSFDEEMPTSSSEQADECAITPKEKTSPDSVPLQRRPLASVVSEEVSESVESVIRSSVLLQPSVNLSASHELKLNMSSAIEGLNNNVTVQQKPLPRKSTVNRFKAKKVTSKTSTSKVKKEESEVSDEQFSLMNSVKSNEADSVCNAQPDADCPQPDGCDNESREIETHPNNLNDNERTLKPSLDTQQPDCRLNPETSSAAGLGRAKRGVELDYHSQNFVKRKRATADACTKDTLGQKLLKVASDSGTLRPSRQDGVVTNPIVDKGQTLKPARKRPAVSTRANKNGKGGQEMFATISETVFNTHNESPPDAMLVCSLDKCSGVLENDLKGSSCKAKPRLKTRTGLGKPDVNNCMELETRMEIASTKEAEQGPLSGPLVRPAIKPLQSTSKRRNITKKPPKRKSPIQSSSASESDGALFSTSSALSVEPLDLAPTDFNTSQHVQKEESLEKGLNQPSKIPRKGLKVAVKGGSQETKQCIQNCPLKAKENQPNKGQGKLSMDPVYFEMTPFEMNQPPVPSPSQPYSDGSVQLDNEVNHDGGERRIASVSEEVFLTAAEASVSVSGLRSSARRSNTKSRRAEKQRRKGRVLHSSTRKGEEVTNSVTMDDADLATASSRSAGSSLSRSLLRSYSCPEIPSFRPHDVPMTSLQSPHHSRILAPPQTFHTPPLHHAHKPLQRARRHTVCSIEVEREIAPLCLRKEVYPSRRSLPYDRATQHLSPSLALSPSTSLSALASCFLSSPLAFLSKKVESRGAAATTSSHVSSSPTYPLIFLQRIDSSSTPTLDYSSSGNPMECERRRQSEEEDDGEDTSSSSQEFEDVALREEKALSDSEIKVAQKREERGKVSSIRIRKTLPKPQNNLTPMGLPKPIRLKKKEFSLEEIYTNKNFSKPPESRLETIFEVPLNRRNGSESWFGQRRVKRFLEFLDAGEVRKPKKPLVGVGKAGASSSRTRRGGFLKDEPPLSAQDVDSLLCAKLDQLNLWLIRDQEDS